MKGNKDKYSVESHSFNVAIAIKFGMPVAILLNHMYHYHKITKRQKDRVKHGLVWNYGSVRSFCEDYGYMSRGTIDSALNKMRLEKLIVFANLNKKKYDRTRWYALTSHALVYYGVQNPDRGVQNPDDYTHSTSHSTSHSENKQKDATASSGVSEPESPAVTDGQPKGEPVQSPTEDHPTQPSSSLKKNTEVAPKSLGYSEEFEVFWVDYGKVGVKSKAYKPWKRLSVDQKEDASNYLREYVVRTNTDGTYPSRKHAATFLNEKTWETPIDSVAPIQKPKNQNSNGQPAEQTYQIGGKSFTTASIQRAFELLELDGSPREELITYYLRVDDNEGSRRDLRDALARIQESRQVVNTNH